MARLKAIRHRMGSIKSIQQVTRAMKMVAAAKLRRAQAGMFQARPYAHRVRRLLYELLPQLDRSLLPALRLAQVNPASPSGHGNLGTASAYPVGRTLVVVVTSDRGMAGSFNANLIRTAETVMKELGQDRVDVLCIGKKGRDHFARRGFHVVESYLGFWGELDFGYALRLGQEIITRYTGALAARDEPDQTVDQVMVVFSEFRNVLRQEVRSERLLPLIVEDGWAETDDQPASSAVLFEPSLTAVVRSLIPRHLNSQVWRYLLESYASEQAARMTAMENATQNAGDVLDALRLQYNKARQAGVTREMLDIVGGAEALRLAA